MKTRSISAFGVLLVGIIPALFGGPVWAITFAAICMIAFVEYHGIASNISGRIPKVGILLIPCFAAIPFTNNQERLAMGLVALAVFLPFMSATRRRNLSGATTDWALSAAGTLYLGAALFGAVQLRQMIRHGLPAMAHRSRFQPLDRVGERASWLGLGHHCHSLHLACRYARLYGRQ